MPNRLINEQSLYLQQHAHNPVEWYPWGDEAFEAAKQQNKPVIVSIGYAACHWCHVMERESFEDAATAAYMNEHFINIKVDREEHPDVDQLYMDAVQAISGSGGWPLNVFVTPEKIPFYGGTYYPPRPAYNRPSWMQLMERIREVWSKQPDEVRHQSEQMVSFLKNASQIGVTPAGGSLPEDVCDQMAAALLNYADKKDGGFGNAPKFPQTMAIRFLLEYHRYTGNKDALQHALLSLDKMMQGGIYDQIGGGFARYSTDAQWLAPHFEKMLYDNALLISVYSAAYTLTKNENYRRVIRETIDFAERELKDETGVYYSALDADSEGEEGKFYTWTWDEWKPIFEGDEEPLFNDYFGIEKEGNWEQTNILHVSKNIGDIAEERGVAVDLLQEKINNAKHKLFAIRNSRIRPLTDDKSLLSWNALMNIALVNASVALNEEAYVQKAVEHMQSLLERFEKEGHLFHVWKARDARIAPNLEDYSYLIQALLQLASVTGDISLLSKASKYCDRVVHEFLQENGVLFYYTSAYSTNVPVRKVDLYDGALPSANAMMCQNLLLLGSMMSRTDWLEQGHNMLLQMAAPATKHTLSFSYWALLSQRYVRGMKTVVVAGEDSQSIGRILRQDAPPHGYVVCITSSNNDIPLLEEKYYPGRTNIFVCTHDACFSPVTNTADALKLIG